MIYYTHGNTSVLNEYFIFTIGGDSLARTAESTKKKEIPFFKFIMSNLDGCTSDKVKCKSKNSMKKNKPYQQNLITRQRKIYQNPKRAISLKLSKKWLYSSR